MRQSEFLPCDSGMYYFCLSGLTGGIEPKEKKRRVAEYSCSTGVNTTGCTKECVIIIDNISSYYRIYYSNQPGNTKSNEKKKKYKFPAMGCAIYEEPIFDVCWDKVCDKYSNNDIS